MFAVLDDDGEIAYATRLGGSDRYGDYATAVAVRADSAVWVVGVTRSEDMPTTKDAMWRSLRGSRSFLALFTPVD